MCSICDYRCEIGENSLWHDIEKHLYWCEIPTGRLFRYDPGNGKHEQSPSPICRCQKFDCVAKKIAVGTCCFRLAICMSSPGHLEHGPHVLSGRWWDLAPPSFCPTSTIDGEGMTLRIV